MWGVVCICCVSVWIVSMLGVCVYGVCGVGVRELHSPSLDWRTLAQADHTAS